MALNSLLRASFLKSQAASFMLSLNAARDGQVESVFLMRDLNISLLIRRATLQGL